MIYVHVSPDGRRNEIFLIDWTGSILILVVPVVYVRGSCKKFLSLGSEYFSATFYQTYFHYKPSKYSPFAETHFCTILPSREKQINSLLLVSVGDTD